MVFYLEILCIALILFLLLGLVRIIKGPSYADQMLALQLFGTTSVALLIILSVIKSSSHLLNVALVVALLTSIGLVTFLRFSLTSKTEGNHDTD